MGAVCSQAYILCTCPALDFFRREQLYSIRTANLRVPPGPRRLLVSKYFDMTTAWEPLENRAFVWTGLPNKAQREALQYYISPLSLRHSRKLLLGTGRSFAPATSVSFASATANNLSLLPPSMLTREQFHPSTSRCAIRTPRTPFSGTFETRLLPSEDF